MEEFRIFVPGAAVPQGRPRITTRSGFPRAYDPAKSRNYKALVARIAGARIAEMTKADAAGDGEGLRFPIADAVCLSVTEHREIPRSWSRKKHVNALAEDIQPVSRPDLDNVVKALKDALTGVVWRDDSVVTEIHAAKIYSDTPGVEIIVSAARKGWRERLSQWTETESFA